MIADDAYHYPPDLLNLMVDGIAHLVRSKESVIDFFRGAGVPKELLSPWLFRVKTNRQEVRKTDITRDVLRTVNEMGDNGLALRREILKRVVEWEDFSLCYPDKQLVAQGLVANIRRVVNVKDAFTRMNLAHERERMTNQKVYQAEIVRKQRQQKERDAIKSDLYALFQDVNAHRRGNMLETVLNQFFKHSGLLVKESFTLTGVGKGPLEQIDGAIQFEGEIYLVEMKWWNQPLGPCEVNSHLSRLMIRAEARGLFISASGFTAAAIDSVRSFLPHRLCVLCELEEIVRLLEAGGSFSDALNKKVQAAIMNKQPLFKC